MVIIEVFAYSYIMFILKIDTNMTYSKWEDGFSFSYINAEFTVIITRSVSKTRL